MRKPLQLTPSERSLKGKLAANAGWAQCENRTERSQAGRDAAEDKLRAKLIAEVDPDGTLSPAEREKRLKNARAAHFQRLAYQSAIARRRRRGGDAA